MRGLEKASKSDDTNSRRSLDQLRTLLQSLEQAARLGIPLRFRIMLEDGKYTMRATRVAFHELGTDESEPVEMERVGQYSITTREKPEEGPPVVLQLHRPDEINQLYEADVPLEDGKIHYAIRFVFQRQQENQ